MKLKKNLMRKRLYASEQEADNLHVTRHNLRSDKLFQTVFGKKKKKNNETKKK